MSTSKNYRWEMDACEKEINYRVREINKLVKQIAKSCWTPGAVEHCLMFIEMHNDAIHNEEVLLEELKEDKNLAECEYCLFSETNPCKVYTNRRIIVLCD